MNRTPLRSIAGLVKNGLPLSYVESLDDAEIMAWGVAFGELDGGVFDWDRLKWRERD